MTYYSIAVSAGTALIVGVLAGVGIFISGALAVAYPNGGLKLDLVERQRTSTRGGKKYTFWIRSYRNVRHVSVF